MIKLSPLNPSYSNYITTLSSALIISLTECLHLTTATDETKLRKGICQEDE